jgi:hypothetical protein
MAMPDPHQHLGALRDSADNDRVVLASSRKIAAALHEALPKNRAFSSKKKSTEEELGNPQIMLARRGASRLPRTP